MQIAERFTKIENHSFNIEIANAFFKAFFEQILSTYNFNLLGMTGFGWTISCFALFYIFATFSGKYFSQRNLYIGLVLFFSTLIYLILLLVFYLTNFSEYEARSLASFARYVGTWYQGLFLAIVLMILSELRLNKDEFLGRTIPSSNLKFKIGSFCVFIVVLTSLSSIYPYTVMTKSNQYKGSDVRVNYNQIKSKIKSAEIPDQSKVWIISQNSSGFDYYILRYEMINLNFGEAPWSLGINDDGTDSFTDADMTIAKWSTELRKYDYVILYTISENFNAEFSSIFESGVAEQSSVYKIRKTMGTVSLVMVR